MASRFTYAIDGARMWTTFRDGALYNQTLIRDAASSPKPLNHFIQCIWMVFGDSLDKPDNQREHLVKRYYNDLDILIFSWASNSPSTEVVDELYSIASEGGIGEKLVAIKLLGHIQNPPSKVKELLVELLSNNEVYDLKRSAAIAARHLDLTDTEVVKALVNIDNVRSKNMWQHYYFEKPFIKALGKLARNYDRMDDVVGLLQVAAIRAPGANLAAVESLGELGYVNSTVAETLAIAILDLDYRVREAATSSLVHLSQLDNAGIITAPLIEVCTNIRDYPHPEVTSQIFQSRIREHGTNFIFEPHHSPDMYNYAYDALWSIMTGELIGNEVIR
jgi:hypothetical protein